MKKIFFLVSFILSSYQFVFSQELSPKETSLSVYQNNYATIQQNVEFNVSSSPAALSFTLPSNNVILSSILLLFNGEILEQTIKQSPDALRLWTNDAIGKDVTLISPNGQSYKGKLMFFSDNEIILNAEDKKSIIVKDYEGFSIIFNDHPYQPQEKTKVTWLLKPSKTGKNNGTLVYHTSGISWTAKYIIFLDEDKERFNLYAWASIVNNSGIDFNNANLKIIEGELNIAQFRNLSFSEGLASDFSLQKMVINSLEPGKEELFEYFQYSYPQKISLKEGESKLLNLFSAENIPFKKTYVYNLYPYPPIDKKEKVSIQISFVNNKQNNLGMLLPKGQIDIYTIGKSNIDFVGQSNIKTIPNGDRATLEIGKVSDLAVEVKKAEHIKVSQDLTERKFKVLCHNFKNQEATIEINYSDSFSFDLLNSNIKPKVKDSNKLVFEVPIKANSTFELSFTIQAKQ